MFCYTFSEICLQTQVAPASLILLSCEVWADFSVKINPVYLFTDLFIYLFKKLLLEPVLDGY
jgi:hypothetical protein